MNDATLKYTVVPSHWMSARGPSLAPQRLIVAFSPLTARFQRRVRSPSLWGGPRPPISPLAKLALARLIPRPLSCLEVPPVPTRAQHDTTCSLRQLHRVSLVVE